MSDTTVADRLRGARRRRFAGRAAELELFRAALEAPVPPFNISAPAPPVMALTRPLPSPGDSTSQEPTRRPWDTWPPETRPSSRYSVKDSIPDHMVLHESTPLVVRVLMPCLDEAGKR